MAKKIDQSKKFSSRIGSFAFFLSFPLMIFFSFVFVIAAYGLFLYGYKDGLRGLVLIIAMIIPLFLLPRLNLQRLRVFIHETKHSALVTLTGNVVKDFVVKRRSGHVEFEMYRDKTQYGPFIALAPYFFPLFSAPILICWSVAELVGFISSPYYFAAVLGFSAGLDWSFALSEVHPEQSDLKRIIGGKLVAKVFIALANTLWVILVLAFGLFGNEIFLSFGQVLMDIVNRLVYWRAL